MTILSTDAAVFLTAVQFLSHCLNSCVRVMTSIKNSSNEAQKRDEPDEVKERLELLCAYFLSHNVNLNFILFSFLQLQLPEVGYVEVYVSEVNLRAVVVLMNNSAFV